MHLRILLAGLLIVAGPIGAALAQSAEESDVRRYADCMEKAGRSPESAFDDAQTWSYEGGGFPARHCAATALMALGHYGEAASRLEHLAEDMNGSEAALRPEVLRQAGRAWLLQDQLERAAAVLTTALKLQPRDRESLIDRSTVLALAGDYWGAIDDLNRAIELDPRDANALVLRAAAYRFVDTPELAMEDVERALRIEPDNVDALLERGNLRGLAGNVEGAREDWIRVLQTAPDSVAADGARANLEKVDVKVDQ